MTINKNSVEQINVALLDMDKKIKSAISNGTSASDFKNLEASVESIKRTLNETTAGLESGKTYNINISGNAATADKATTATTAETATNANHAETATTAEAATTATTAETATTADTATNANHALMAETATKAVGVLDYGDISRTVKIGYYGPGVTADKLLNLAGYTEMSDSSVKIKDVNKEEIIKWLGIPRIKYADYQTPTQTFTQFQQVPIELSKFSSEVTPNNVLCFMVIYWSGVQIIASGDWGSAASSGLKCSLIPLGTGTGWTIIRCVYMV